MIIFAWCALDKTHYFMSERLAIQAFDQAEDDGLDPTWNEPLEVTELLRIKDQLAAKLMRQLHFLEMQLEEAEQKERQP
jgi:hypothetical protein